MSATSCPACADFEADATTAAYTSGCRGCDARALAGTVIFEALRNNLWK